MFLEILQNSQESTCVRLSFLIKLQAYFIKKETLAQVFSCEFYEISKTPFLVEHFWWLLLKRHYWILTMITHFCRCFWTYFQELKSKQFLTNFIEIPWKIFRLTLILKKSGFPVLRCLFKVNNKDNEHCPVVSIDGS